MQRWTFSRKTCDLLIVRPHHQVLVHLLFYPCLFSSQIKQVWNMIQSSHFLFIWRHCLISLRYLRKQRMCLQHSILLHSNPYQFCQYQTPLSLVLRAQMEFHHLSLSLILHSETLLSNFLMMFLDLTCFVTCCTFIYNLSLATAFWGLWMCYLWLIGH